MVGGSQAVARTPLVGYMGRCRGVEVFEKLNCLGEGTYGTVYRARDVESGEIVALKKVRVHSEKEGFPKSALREIRLLRRFEHPNIVELREVVCGRRPNSVFLVFEYCEHDVGALLDFMERPFSQAEVKCLLLQLLRAVECLHAAFVIHRDLKLSNMLLTNRGVLKLADFGMAREYADPPQPCTTNVVTLWYRSPELLLGAHTYTTAVDVWSIGCNFGELLSKKPLFLGRAEEHQLQLMCEVLGTPTPKIWPGLEELPLFRRVNLPMHDYNNLGVVFPDAPDSCLDLLNKMLTFDPGRRPSAPACLRHGYFDDPPAPQEPELMPTFKEHRNETANPRACVTARKTQSTGTLGTKRPIGSAAASTSSAARGAPPAPRSAVFAATKRIRSSIF